MRTTLKEHIHRAGVLAGLLKKHGADLADIADDVPKAIAIAADFHAALKGEPEPVAGTSPVAVKAPVLSAQQAAEHVKEKGISDAERSTFDRASQSYG